MDFSKYVGITYADHLWGLPWITYPMGSMFAESMLTYPFKMSTLQRQLVSHVTYFLVVVPNPMWDLKFWGFPKSSEINLQKNPTLEKRNPAKS